MDIFRKFLSVPKFVPLEMENFYSTKVLVSNCFRSKCCLFAMWADVSLVNSLVDCLSDGGGGFVLACEDLVGGKVQ